MREVRPSVGCATALVTSLHFAPPPVRADAPKSGGLTLEHHHPDRGVCPKQGVRRPQSGEAGTHDGDAGLAVAIQRLARCEVVAGNH